MGAYGSPQLGPYNWNTTRCQNCGLEYNTSMACCPNCGAPWGKKIKNNSGGNNGVVAVVITLLFIVAVLLYLFWPKIAESNTRSKTYSIEDTVKTSTGEKGNPFADTSKYTPTITTGTWWTNYAIDNLNNKFYFKVWHTDNEDNPLPINIILDLAVSNDGGKTKIFLCTDRYIDKSDLDEKASIALTFPLDKVKAKKGTIIYYSLKKNEPNALPSVGERTIE